MNVLEHHQEGLTLCQSFDLSQLGMKRSLLLLLRREIEWRIAVACRDGQQVGQEKDGRTEVVGSPCEHCLQLFETLCVRVLAAEPRRPFELGNARIKCAVLVVGRAEIAQTRVRFAGKVFQERGRNP